MNSRNGLGKPVQSGIGPAAGGEALRKKRTRRNAIKDSGSLSMTAMIDVTFQLLIFFMVGCQFKTFEGKIAAYLPRGVGPENTPVEEQELPLKVQLRWNAPRKQCRVMVGRIFCGYDSDGLAKALEKVRRIKLAGLRKAEIEAGGDVRMVWVVQALNMLVKAGLMEINFTGSANPLAG